MTRTSYTARNGDVHLAVDDLGGAGGDPLLLIMGLGVSRFYWPDGLVDALIDAGFHVASFDGRDAGGSTHFDDVPVGNQLTALFRRRPPAYTAEDMADDTVAVLDVLGWQRAHLFGISQGGLVAQRTALRHPERVHTITSFAAIPSDVRGAAVLRYVRLPFLARLARMRHPAGRDGDVAAGLDLLRAVASPAIRSTRRTPASGWSANSTPGCPAASATAVPRPVRSAPPGTARACASCACRLWCCTASRTRWAAPPPAAASPRPCPAPATSNCPAPATTCPGRSGPPWSARSAR